MCTNLFSSSVKWWGASSPWVDNHVGPLSVSSQHHSSSQSRLFPSLGNLYHHKSVSCVDHGYQALYLHQLFSLNITVDTAPLCCCDLLNSSRQSIHLSLISNPLSLSLCWSLCDWRADGDHSWEFSFLKTLARTYTHSLAETHTVQRSLELINLSWILFEQAGLKEGQTDETNDCCPPYW